MSSGTRKRGDNKNKERRELLKDTTNKENIDSGKIVDIVDIDDAKNIEAELKISPNILYDAPIWMEAAIDLVKRFRRIKQGYQYPAFWRVMDMRPRCTGFGHQDGRVYETFSKEQVDSITNSFKSLSQYNLTIIYPIGDRLLSLIENMTTKQILKIGKLWAVDGIRSTLLNISTWSHEKIEPCLLDLLENNKHSHANDVNKNFFQDASNLSKEHANDPIIKWIFKVIDECTMNIQLGVPPGGERSSDIHFVRMFMEVLRSETEYHYGELISSASGARRRRLDPSRIGQHSDYIFGAYELRDATAERGREFGIAENAGPDCEAHHDKSMIDFMRVTKVARDQHSACAHALYEAAGGNVDANLQKALKQIPIVGICIVGYSVRVHVVFYLGNGIWALDEVSSCTLPNISMSSLNNIAEACRIFLFVKHILKLSKTLFKSAMKYAVEHRTSTKEVKSAKIYITDHSTIDGVRSPPSSPKPTKRKKS